MEKTNKKVNKIISEIRKLKRNGFLKLKPLQGEVRFKCQRCGKCCNSPLPIILTKEDQKNTEVIKKSSTWYGFKVLKGNGKCPFFEKRGCKIYSKRPSVCKAYPFHYDPFTKKFYFDENCPGIGHGKIVSQQKLREIKNYRLSFWRSITSDTKSLLKICQAFFL